MPRRSLRLGTGHAWGPWPVLGVLLAAVLVPTACVLWFMAQVVRNERLVVRQKLEQTYRAQLPAVRRHLAEFWQARLADLAARHDSARPGETFAALVRKGVCDSAVLYGPDGGILYPARASPIALMDAADSYAWAEATRLEYESELPHLAVKAYAQLARRVFGIDLPARALRSWARCLVKTGQEAKALEILADRLANPRYRSARDEMGRFIVPDAQLLALRLIADPNDARFPEAAERLVATLEDYSWPAMPSSQRRFLMRQAGRLLPGRSFATLGAEELAGEYVQAGETWRFADRLRRTPLADTWMLSTPDGGLVALFDQGRIIEEMAKAVAAAPFVPDARVTIRPRSADDPSAETFLSEPAGGFMPDWELSVELLGTSPFAAAAARQNVLYFWTGGLSIAAIAVLALLVAGYVSRQMKLTRLKNDLIATVSHELKTPLSSMQVLIDTLLEGRCRDDGQARDYFAMLARENRRLARLIENFLAFSRMERNKNAFHFAPLDVREVIDAALASIRDRFAGPACRLDVQVQPNLPAVTADRDALITVVLNLLDNAWKYTQDDKHVALRVQGSSGCVTIRVHDNGIGLSRRDARKVFDRFYQADRNLAGGRGGCGLGLSIVHYIVSAHGGTIAVDSQPGKGSTFTVTLPAAGRPSGPGDEEAPKP
ncbi:MAG TPA: HAMP domain-containing sensor histidine kinase [Phycisphaerae bacterium]|nr:HAMP domain-containing sensor histidine kinase [Phycisphaerae bacterium]HUT62027.1 HAMP domain-containing sensor histidine kinase [Phycisphaerae bacterium]